MKKKIFMAFLMLTLVTVCQSEATTTYNFNISGIDYTGVAINEQIADFVATINGTFGTDWTLGPALGDYATNWFFMGGTTLIGANATVAPFPLNNGDILQIISPNDSNLMITAFNP